MLIVLPICLLIPPILIEDGLDHIELQYGEVDHKVYYSGLAYGRLVRGRLDDELDHEG
jgi:hypothetical protein